MASATAPAARKTIYAFIILAAIIIILLIMGRKNLSTGIIINAPQDTVWKAFTDFNHYPKWNPFIKKLTGVNYLSPEYLRGSIRFNSSESIRIKLDSSRKKILTDCWFLLLI